MRSTRAIYRSLVQATKEVIRNGLGGAGALALLAGAGHDGLDHLSRRDAVQVGNWR